MKIALVHKRFDRIGGAEWDCFELARRLADRDNQVHLVVGDLRTGVPDGVQVHRVPIVKLGQTMKLVSFAALAPRVWRRIDADVVIGFGRTFGQDVVRLSLGSHRGHLARRARSGGARESIRRELSIYDRAKLAIERRTFASGGHRLILAVSELTRDEVLQSYPELDPARIEVLHYGVDTELFHPRRRAVERPSVLADLDIPADRPVCLMVGSGFERKGVNTLLEAWAHGGPGGAALVVVGNDGHLERYRARAAELPGPVRFVGPRSDVDRFCAAADVFALPSLYEGCPVSIIEALAAGVPVVTSSATGAPELLTGALGELLVDDPRDAGAVRSAIARALDPERGPELRGLARAAGCRSDVDAVTSRLEAICERLAMGRRA